MVSLSVFIFQWFTIRTYFYYINIVGFLETQDRGSRIEDRGSRIGDRGSGKAGSTIGDLEKQDRIKKIK